MRWSRAFLIVTLGALAGMVMGELFGLAAGAIAPDLFRQIIPLAEIEPVGLATVLGAVAVSARRRVGGVWAYPAGVPEKVEV